MNDVDLSDIEIDNICQGRVQNAAKLRHLRGMGLSVRRKPNGRPLVNRMHYNRIFGQPEKITAFEPNWSVE